MYRVSRLLTGVASLVCPRVMPMTCGGDKAAGQRIARALLCKQGVGGSSPLVSTDEVPGRRGNHSIPTADEHRRVLAVVMFLRDHKTGVRKL